MNLLQTFYNDPFFSEVNLPRALALEYPSNYNQHDRRMSKRQDSDLFTNPFALMQNMMNQMGTFMKNDDSHGPNLQGISFSSATVMSMDNTNGGEPRIFQATSDKLRGPEGLERTRKAVRDTSRHLEKMEIAHRLGERAHRIVKERDPNTGHLLENREFDHIDDENEFEREWFGRAEKLGLKNLNSHSFNSQPNSLLRTPHAIQHRRSQSQEPRHLAIEHGQSKDKRSRHKK